MLEKENKHLRERLTQLEDARRILNLKVDGVKEEKDENLRTRIVTLAQAMGSVC